MKELLVLPVLRRRMKCCLYRIGHHLKRRPPKVTAETIRVAKDRALSVFEQPFAWRWQSLWQKTITATVPPICFGAFGTNVDHVYWREDFENESRYTSCVVFRSSSARLSDNSYNS
jgi:hypothetical protein